MKHKHFEKLGSIYGFVLTLISVSLCFVYFTINWVDMFNNDKDRIESINLLNTFEEKHRFINMEKM